MTFQEKRAKLGNVLENIYLFLFGLLLAYLFSKLTSFTIKWQIITETAEGGDSFIGRIFLVYPFYALLAVAVLRTLIQESYNWKKCLETAAVVLVGYGLWRFGSHKDFFLLWILILGAREIPFEKIVKVFLTVCGSILLAAMICAGAGVIEDYTYTRSDGALRHALGTGSPTNCGAFLFFQILCWWYLRKDKITYYEAAVVLGISVFVRQFINARTAAGCIAGIAAVMCIQRALYRRAERQNREFSMNSILASILILSHIFMAGFIIVVSALFDGNIPWMLKLNALFSNRLSLGRKAMDLFEFTWFGQYIRNFSHAEGLTAGGYFYIDSSYLQIALMYGVLWLAVVLFVLLVIGCRAKRQQDWTMVWILAFMAIHSVIEPRLIQLAYNPFILALLADTGRREGLRIEEIIRIKWVKKREF